MESTNVISKEKDNSIFRFISKHKFISSLILCLLFFLIYLPLNGFQIYTGGDDPVIYNLISHGEIGIGFMGYFFAGFVSVFDPIFSAVNLNFYFIINDIICFLSLAIINYLLLSKLFVKKGLFFSIIFDIVFFAFLIIVIQFTMTAVAGVTAGIMCVINGSAFEKRKRVKWLQIIGGGFLTIVGSEVRFDPFKAMMAVLAAFAFGVFLSAFLKNKKSLGFKDALLKTVKKYLKTGIAVLIVAATVFSVNLLSENLKYTDSNYEDFSGYNDSLAKVIDYRIANFFANKDFYRSIDIKSFAETNILKRWCVDDDFFTKEKLDAISDYSKEYALDGAGSDASFKVLFRLIGPSLSEHVKSGLIILDVSIIIIVLFALWLLWLLKRKIFNIVFPIILFSAMWGILLFTTGGLTASKDNCNLLMLPIAIFSIYVSVFYNRYQKIIMFFLSAAVIVFYLYLYLSRIHFTAALCIYMPAYVLMIYSLNSDYRKKFNFKKHPMLLKRIAAGVLVITSVASGALLLTRYSYVAYPSDYDEVEEYINSHPENLFVQDSIYRTRNNFNAFAKPTTLDNAITFGGWDKHSRTYKESLKDKDIDHLFEEAIDSNMVFVFFNYTKNPDNLNAKIGDFQIYYNDHYAPEGKTVLLKEIKSFDKYNMYKVVSVDASETEQ